MVREIYTIWGILRNGVARELLLKAEGKSHIYTCLLDPATSFSRHRNAITWGHPKARNGMPELLHYDLEGHNKYQHVVVLNYQKLIDHVVSISNVGIRGFRTSGHAL